ncbi:glutathione S-transferase family protein [Allorhizobium sp. BGMRC 0089]|uniref:glutathione S-transferase family protein n=1 Tax=Allorhizobium sonneratiae TaxID=2934936 RepID=UPI0020336A6D|nr:glutathione S-transferase family protein [Allorhizobium sonneratiae]MCM2294014.1 glutathione S-transferase family protein [Allorhizobium sonneratiae]
MITLYGDVTKTRANRCSWMLKELGVDYDNKPLAFHPGSAKPDDFLALNPNGKCPTLTDGDIVLYESLAINLYLARTYGAALGPQSPKEDALMQQWSFWVATEIEKPLLLTAAVRCLFEPHGNDEEDQAIALKKLSRPWGVLDRHLQNRSYILGDRFTVADLNVAAVMHFIPIAGIDIGAWPSMQAWLETCLRRAAAIDLRSVDFKVPHPATSRDIFAMFL